MAGLVGIPLFALLIIYSACRFCFWTFNPSLFATVSAINISQAFLLGVLFDASILILMHAPLLVLMLLVVDPGVRLRRFLNFLVLSYFIVIDIPLLVGVFVDIAYFPFTGRRSTFAALALGGDMQQQAIQLSVQYWYLWLIGFGALSFFFTALRIAAFSRDFRRHGGIFYRVVTSFLILLLLVLFGRGWYQKPLATAHAFALGDSRVAALTLNTPFVALHGLRRPTLQSYNFFADWQDVLRVVSEPPLRFQSKANKNYNVVIIVLESFSSEYSGLFNSYSGYMPFFDSLARQGLYFDQSYANGRRSIDAMPAILAGLPEFMEEAYVRSPYAANELHTLPRVLRDVGYHTAFFHGGKNGTMFFDIFAQLAGIEEYYGYNEYPDKRDSDGDWGIFDEPFMQFAGYKMSSFKEPFFAHIFTLSSHNPYPIPQEHRGRFPKGTLPIHESIGYADHALAQFFAFAQKQPWYERTLFVLTGDHTSLSDNPSYQNEGGAYRVPIVFFAPGVQFNNEALRTKVVQHADIPISVMDFVGVHPKRATLFGRSVFDEQFPGRVVNRVGGSYMLIEDKRMSLFTGEESLLDKNDVNSALQRRQRAWLQYFNNGMLDNKLYIDVTQ